MKVVKPARSAFVQRIVNIAEASQSHLSLQSFGNLCSTTYCAPISRQWPRI